MCGIAGGVAIEPGAQPDEHRVRRMLGKLAHRGPDGEGIWRAPSGLAVLGHRRLAVIDLATGDQPMVTPGEKFAIAFNGEIYNYIELRNDLSPRNWLSTSDTEVLLVEYQVRGRACVDRLHGMFAFAIWDEARQTLMLARDHLGEKPLYYTIDRGCLYFASSLAALAETAPRKFSVSSSGLHSYIAAGFVPAPDTIYNEGSKLKAGTTLVVGPRTPLHVASYWHPSRAPLGFEGTFDDAVDRAREILVESIKCRLRSDVPLGVFLSGGIDSSLVAAIAQRDCGVQLRTFSIGFSGTSHDETSHARMVATHLGTDHHEFDSDVALLRLVDGILDNLGEPFADPATLPLWTLAEQTRQQVTVALGGDGGDEGFAGYSWYRTAHRLEAARKRAGGKVMQGPRRIVAEALRLGSSPRAQRLARSLDAIAPATRPARYASLRRLFSERDLRQLIPGSVERPSAIVNAETTHEAAGGDSLRRMQAVDIEGYLADGLNLKLDVGTMGHALEARSPLLERDLIEFGLSLPAEYLMDGSTGKRILRQLLYKYVPREIVERPKHGFTLPVDEWFRADASLGDRLVSSEAWDAVPGVSRAGLARVVADHAAGTRDNGDRLFALLTLERWARSL
jgi:asparagine synthase (glutamine-hydrolysing)